MTNSKITSLLNFPSMIVVLAVLTISRTAYANLFVAHFEPSQGAGKIGEYTNSGKPINPSLISGFPRDIAISGDKLFVLTQLGTVDVYTTSGQIINASLITGLGPAQAIAIEGNNLFVGTNANFGTVAQYTTSGALVNASLITGLQSSFQFTQLGDLAISGGHLFVASFGTNNGSTYGSTVGEYSLMGMPLDPALITHDGIAIALGVSGSQILSGPPQVTRRHPASTRSVSTPFQVRWWIRCLSQG